METWLKMRFAPLFWTGAMHLGERDNWIFYVMIMMMIMMMISKIPCPHIDPSPPVSAPSASQG